MKSTNPPQGCCENCWSDGRFTDVGCVNSSCLCHQRNCFLCAKYGPQGHVCCHTPQQESNYKEASPESKKRYEARLEPTDASWEERLELIWSRGDIPDYAADVKTVLKALIKAEIEKAYQEGQDNGARGKFFSSIEMTEPLPKQIHDKIFEAGILEGRRRAVEYIKEKIELFTETREDATDAEKGFQNALHTVRSVLEAASQEPLADN